ncbi:MAG: AAA family ATPase [Proteobacteria bacterium]|nr:AAA family ATPase [Pseudomonadota bacterium]
MLTHLNIRDLAIVESLELDFSGGLTVLTGETGAGKSIVVDALTLLCGARAATDQIRAGADRAEVAGTFDIRQAPRSLRALLEEQSIEVDDELLVRRVVTTDGRSRAYLNGQSVAVQQLREVVSALLDVHGQHEFQSLVRGAAQRELLDRYGRLDSLAEVEAAHGVWLACSTGCWKSNPACAIANPAWRCFVSRPASLPRST